MKSHNPFARRVIWAVAGTLFVALAYIGFNSRQNNVTESATATIPPELTPTSPPEFMMPTLLPPPSPEGREFFPEYVLHRYAYDEAAYPQYAEVLPDAPCATWENGGLSWSFFEDIPSMKLGWGASVWLPIYRFCGFPLPFPQKPTQTKIDDAPREWVTWKSTQLAIMPPGPTITPSP